MKARNSSLDAPESFPLPFDFLLPWSIESISASSSRVMSSPSCSESSTRLSRVMAPLLSVSNMSKVLLTSSLDILCPMLFFTTARNSTKSIAPLPSLSASVMTAFSSFFFNSIPSARRATFSSFSCITPSPLVSKRSKALLISIVCRSVRTMRIGLLTSSLDARRPIVRFTISRKIGKSSLPLINLCSFSYSAVTTFSSFFLSSRPSAAMGPLRSLKLMSSFPAWMYWSNVFLIFVFWRSESTILLKFFFDILAPGRPR
mmetsp:Transcript_26901/g.50225  ORF Transcript_26901/g.50225 Transcript_26901/m.50225 type:complete len:259 (-) Transcript_26901:8-784(-)